MARPLAISPTAASAHPRWPAYEASGPGPRTLSGDAGAMSEQDAAAGRSPSRISPTTYGGQAVMEGVMMRGRRWASVAVRAPNQEIVIRSERLPVHLYA